MSEITVGSVAVEVVPSTRRFPAEARRQINPEAVKIGQEFGRMFGSSAEREMANGVRDGLRAGGRQAGQDGAKQGSDFGGGFARALKARLEAAFRSLPDIEINADSSGADREIATIKAELAELRDKRIGIDISAERAMAEVERLNEQLRLLNRESPEVEIRTDSGRASAELQKFRAEVRRLDGQHAEVNVDADTAGASAQLALLRGQALGARAGFTGLLAAALLLGPALIPIGAAGAGAMAAIAIGAGAAVAGLGVLLLALVPVVAAVQAVQQAHAKSAASARGSTSAHLQMASAIDAVKSAQQGLKSAEEDAADARIRATEQIRQAERSLADAKHQAALDAVESDRRIADARRELADVVRRSAADQVEAEQRVQEASRSVADAQRDLLDAQQAVNDAREQAVRDAEDLAQRISGGKLDERDAILRVQEAQERLAEVQKDPTATDLQRKRAQLAVDQAVAGLERQRTENERLAQQQEELTKSGLEGSKVVKDAKDALTEADRRQMEMQAALAEAAAAAARQQQKSARDVAGAHRNVADAVAQAAERQRRDQQSIADAEQRVAQATRDAAIQQRKSAESIAQAQQGVISAQRGVQQASQSAGATGGAAMDTVRSKLDALSPAGRKFVTFITGTLLPALRPLGKAAQTAILPGLQEAITALLPALPSISRLITVFGKAIGNLAVEAAESLGDPVWKEFFDFLATDGAGIMTIVGRIVIQMANAFAGLAVAFGPVAKQVLNGLLHLATGFADFAANADPDSPLGRFISYIKEIGPQVATTFLAIGEAIGHILVSLAPLAPIALTVVTVLARLISSLPPPVLAAIVVGIGALAASMTVLNAGLAINNALLAANPVVLVIGAIVVAIAALAAALIVLWKHNETFRETVKAVWDAVSGFIQAAWEQVIQPTFAAIAGFVTGKLVPAFQTYLLPILRIVWEGIKVAIRAAWVVVKAIFEAAVTYVRSVLAPVFTWLWHNIVEPTWTGIRLAISVAWALIKVTLGLIEIFIKAVLAPVFTWLWHNVIEPVWNGIKSTISSVWEKGIKPVLSAIGDFLVSHVAPAFKTGVDAIGKAWEKVKDVAKLPVKFVIETVINDGIIGAYNKVAGFFHVDKVDPVKLPNGFATGGFVSGPGGPRDDMIPAMLSNGEFVINAASVRRIGLDFLEYINRGGSFGGDVAGVGRFATGGAVRATKQWLPSVDPLPYRWGAVGPGAFDCSGLAGEVWARVTEHANNTRYFTTASNLRQFGFTPGLGMFTLGLNPGHHVVGMLDGLGFEARSTATGIFVGPSATDPRGMPQQWYLARLPGTPGKEPDGISIFNPIGSVEHIFDGVFKGLSKFDSPWGHVVAAVPHALVDGAKSFIADHVPGLADGGYVTKYDEGGYIPPGLTTVLNATGKPEPVLTSQQWDSMRTAGPTELSGELFLDSGEYLGSVKGTVREVLREGRSTSADMRALARRGPGPRT